MQYNHHVSVSGLIVNENDEVLLVKNAFRGWECPTGFVAEHESLQNALERIIFDETGVNITILDLVGINKDLTFNNVNVDFICKYESGELVASGSSQEVKWVNKMDAKLMVRCTCT